MTGPSIQPTQRPSNQPRISGREAPTDLVARTLSELPGLSAADASARLRTIRGAIANGTLDGDLSAVRSATQGLQERIATEAHANAPMAQLAPRRGGRASRVQQAIGQAFTQSRQSAQPQQAFLDNMQGQLGGSRGLARELSRTSPEDFKRALMNQGATFQEASEARTYVERAVAHQFERAVQQHVQARFEGLTQELERAATGQGPEFEARLNQISGTGGQRLMRVMRGMGIDTSELSARVDAWGAANADRPAVVQSMRAPLQTALSEMRDMAHTQLAQVSEAHFLDEPYTEFQGAIDSVAQDWGLPRGVLSRPARSVVAHGLQQRNAEATGAGGESAAARRLAGRAAGMVGGPASALFKLATAALDYGRATGNAERTATMAEVGEGDPGAAIETRTGANVGAAQTAASLVGNSMAGEVSEHAAEGVLGGAQGLVRGLTGAGEQLATGGRDVARELGEMAIEQGTEALLHHGEEAFTEALAHQDRPAVRKRAR